MKKCNLKGFNKYFIKFTGTCFCNWVEVQVEELLPYLPLIVFVSLSLYALLSHMATMNY